MSVKSIYQSFFFLIITKTNNITKLNDIKYYTLVMNTIKQTLNQN